MLGASNFIRSRKFAKQSSRPIVVGDSGGLFGGEQSEMLCFPMKGTACRPFRVLSIPRNSSISGGVVNSLVGISMILGWRALAQVFSLVIQAITILVVYVWRCGTNDKAMHQNLITAIGSANRVKSLGIFGPYCRPIGSTDAFKIGDVNYRALPLRQGNKPDSLVLRLNNKRSLNAGLGHDLTSNEIAVFDRFSILPSFLEAF